MPAFVRELLTIDRPPLDLRAGVLGLVVLAGFGAAVGLVGPEAIAAAIGALVVLATDPPPSGRSWAGALVPLVAGGAALTWASPSLACDRISTVRAPMLRRAHRANRTPRRRCRVDRMRSSARGVTTGRAA